MGLSTVVNLADIAPVGVVGCAIQSTALVANLMLRGAVDSTAGIAMVLAAVVLLAIRTPIQMLGGTANGTASRARCFCCFGGCNSHVRAVRRISRSRENAHDHQESQQK